MIEEGPGLIELGVAGGEEAVPEEGYFLLERTPGRNHAIQPGRSGGVKLTEFRLIDVIAPDDVLRHGLRVAGVEQFLNHRRVTLRHIGLEVLPGGAKPGAAQQMRHECDVLLMHAAVSFHTRLCYVECSNVVFVTRLTL